MYLTSTRHYIVLNVYKDSKISQDPVLWNHAPYTQEWATAAEKPKTSVSYKLYVLRKKCIFFNILITIFQNDFFFAKKLKLLWDQLSQN